MPVIIQGLGARSKVDAPTAGWDSAKRFVDEATARGAAVYSMAMSKPFNRTFDLAAGTKLYEGALALNRLFTEATTVPERLAMRSEEHTSELQSLMRISYAVFCLKQTQKKKQST